MESGEMDQLPYEHGRLPAMVTVANGEDFSDGFGEVVIRAGEGRSVLVEVTEGLSGVTVVATIDAFRGIRSRSWLQVNELCEAIQSAAREDGVPTPFPIAR